MKLLLGKFSYANVMATIAVFIALGGASYAAVKLPKNSVGSKQLKKESVTAAKVGKGAITAAKLAPGVSTMGPRGEPGRNGTNGNANVVTYSLGPHDFASSQFFVGSISGLQGVDLSKGTWSAELVSPEGIHYPVPGTAQNNSTSYRTYLEGGSEPNLNIVRQVGPGENYQNVLFTWIEASSAK